MGKFNELFDKYQALTETQKNNIGKGFSNKIINYLKSIGRNNDDIQAFFLKVFKLTISADKNLSNKEHAYYKAIAGLDISYDVFFEKTNYGASQDFINECKNEIFSFPQDIRDFTLGLIVLILASDGPINDTEKTFFFEFCQ